MSVEASAQHSETWPSPQPKRWFSLIAFAFAIVVDGSEGNLINGLFPTLREVLGLSLLNLSMLGNVNKLISALLGPVWAMAADKYQRKKILVFVTGFWGMWTLALGLTQNFGQLLVLYAIASLGSVASTPIIMSAMTDMFADSERGKAMGVFGALSVILAAMVTPLFSQFAEAGIWRWGFVLAGGFSVLSGALIAWSFRDPGRGATESRDNGAIYKVRTLRLKDFGALFKIRTLVLLFLQKFLNAGLLVWSFGTVYMVDVFGYRNREAILMVSVPLLLGSILGNILGGVLGDRANRRHPYTGRIALLQGGFLGSALMSYLCTQVAWDAKAMFYVTYFFWGIFLSFGTGLDRPMIAAVTPPELRATAYGIWMSLGDAISSIIIGSLAGWLGDRFGLQPVFLWLLTGVMTVRVLVWFALYRPYAHDVRRMRGLLA